MIAFAGTAREMVDTNGVRLIYSEDFQDGREVERVRFRNPSVL